MLKPKVPGFGFGAAALALVCTIVGFVMFFLTYAAGGYAISRWTIMCSVLSMWLLVLLMLNGIFAGEKPVWTAVIYAVIAFLLTYGTIRFIQPCLTQIGIYFTVNMGDVEMNRIVTFRSITSAAFYVAAIIMTIVSAFLPMTFRGGKSKTAPAEEQSEVKQ